MSTQYVYVMKGVSKKINGKPILNETWLSFIAGAKIGIIGHNGAGKSTLLKIIAGIDTNYEGEAFHGKDVKIGYLPQEPVLDSEKNVYDNIMEGLKDKKDTLDEFHNISLKLAEDISADEMQTLLEKLEKLQAKIDFEDLWNLDSEIEIAMSSLGCPPKDKIVKNISGGEKRRVALCKLLLSNPTLLLLDEPTNHLDAESVLWLEKFLSKYKGTVISITHDRYFLDNVAEWILEIDHGNCIPWHSNYSHWLEKKEEQLLTQKKQDVKRLNQIKKEAEWVKQSAKGRQSKNKARLAKYHEIVNQKNNTRITNDASQIIIAEGPRLGNKVININNISKKYGDKTLIDNFSFTLVPGAIVGVIGPNGAGKSTLFNIITGSIQPDVGNIELGETVSLGYVNQSRADLDNNNTVWQEISGGSEILEFGKITLNTRAYCSSFNFKGQKQQQNISTLSGGERNRVHMAKLLKSCSNVILLDEPSNDLDVDTLRSLEEAILNFPGCVMVVSHDRWFLDRICTHIIAFQGEGKVDHFEGNYSAYHEYLSMTNSK